MFDLFVLVLWISAGIFLIVTGLILFALWRGSQRAALPAQNFGNHQAEIFWMIGPVVIVLWIVAISAKLVLTMNAVPVAHPNHNETTDVDLVVIGHQWWWEVKYNGSEIIGANEIHIPTGKPVRVQLESADVIHSFWVPQLGRKMDAIPGRQNYVWLQANEPGTYQGRCAEFCGNQHAWMNFDVFAHEPKDYEHWLAGRKIPPQKVDSTSEIAGERLFFSLTCVNCHAISGTSAVATIGPDLTNVAERQYLAGGVLPNSSENLRRWLKDPQAIKPGCKMPDFRLSDTAVSQLVAYLESLR